MQAARRRLAYQSLVLMSALSARQAEGLLPTVMAPNVLYRSGKRYRAGQESLFRMQLMQLLGKVNRGLQFS